MKVYKITRPLTIEEVRSFLDNNLDGLFEKRRQLSLHFEIATDGDVLEINNKENYDGFLFRIEFKGAEIDVTKSEHYTDDVNAIAIEVILEDYFAKDGANYIFGEN